MRKMMESSGKKKGWGEQGGQGLGALQLVRFHRDSLLYSAKMPFHGATLNPLRFTVCSTTLHAYYSREETTTKEHHRRSDSWTGKETEHCLYAM